MSHVLFWDVDGTLLTTARAGIHAWEAAAHDVFGNRLDLGTLKTAGLTDPQIAVKIAGLHSSCASSAEIERLVARYEAHLPAALPLRTGRVLPGVLEVLEYLEDRSDVVSLLLTGNTTAGARVKLAHYKLDKYFRGGAFADGCYDRIEVARKGTAIIAAMGPSDAISSVHVIGDTPSDIRCGQAIGATTVAVATGEYGPAELAGYGAAIVLQQLPPPPEFLALLGVSAPAR